MFSGGLSILTLKLCYYSIDADEAFPKCCCHDLNLLWLIKQEEVLTWHHSLTDDIFHGIIQDHEVEFRLNCKNTIKGLFINKYLRPTKHVGVMDSSISCTRWFNNALDSAFYDMSEVALTISKATAGWTVLSIDQDTFIERTRSWKAIRYVEIILQFQTFSTWPDGRSWWCPSFPYHMSVLPEYLQFSKQCINSR